VGKVIILKERFESDELKRLRYLNLRIILSDKDASHYFTIKKGFEGELKFDEWAEENLPSNWIMICDLLLEFINTLFQIDALIFTGDKIYLFNVKYHEGDYYIKDDKWYSPNHTELIDPLNQLFRSESLLKKLLHDLGYNIPIAPYLLFNNPEFHLYGAPKNQPIIYPTQLNRFSKKMNMLTSKTTDSHKKIAEKLISLHIKKSPYERVPEFLFGDLKKGITYACCGSFVSGVAEKKLVCARCGFEEELDAAVLRGVEEYVFLFPERRFTTESIYEWCGGVVSRKVIRKILIKYFKLVYFGKYSYYIYSE
jgi:hypothetical protein